MKVKKFGLQPYQPIWEAMKSFTIERDPTTDDELWLLEHEAVYTQGQAGKSEHILNPRSIPIVQSDRGGQVTYHGPGQLIAYVLMDLRRHHLGVRTLVCGLEQILIDLLAIYKIKAHRQPTAPGVYVDNKKIASLGLRVKNHCTYHGIALNVDLDLDPFLGINPCGYQQLKMTQIKEYDPNIHFVNIQNDFIRLFLDIYSKSSAGSLANDCLLWEHKMHIYADYIEPITVWLHHNPSYALLFTFIIALLESLAIVGTIIPGSLTMTAIGILAGSNVMRLDLTLLFAALGAFFGDVFSYLLGSIYSSRLTTIWPFSKYPTLLRYGQDFFNRHGGKSVLIGRFTGPLRSIIPIIAGMMHMSHWQFFGANFISAIGWSILYILPGYIIGAASHQLSADSAQRLFGLVIGILIAAWVLSLILKYLAKFLNKWFAAHVNNLWQWSKKNKYSRYIMKKLIDQRDAQPQKIISLSLIWFYCLIGTLVLCVLVLQENWLNIINQPILLFLQTLRTSWLDNVLIIVSFIFCPLSLIGLCFLIALFTCAAHDWRLLKYWLGLIATTCITTSVFADYFFIQPAIHLFAQPNPALFPAVYLCIATALCIFLINYLLQKKPNPLMKGVTGLLFLCLLLSGIAILVLGDNWLSSVLGAYSLGASIGLLFWIAYRRKPIVRHPVMLPMLLVPLFLLATTTYMSKTHFKTVLGQHTIKAKQHVLNQDTWWYQYKEPLLPVYSTNRVGRRIGVFNIQYAGSIQELAKRLETCGWKKQPKSFLYTLLIHAEGRYTTEELPFMEPVYLNKNPALTMSFHTVKDDNLYILRLWRSNYHLMHYQEPIWLGNIILARKKTKTQPSFAQKRTEGALFTHILPAVHDYQIARIDVKDPHLKSLPYEIPSELLIIKN